MSKSWTPYAGRPGDKLFLTGRIGPANRMRYIEFELTYEQWLSIGAILTETMVQGAYDEGFQEGLNDGYEEDS